MGAVQVLGVGLWAVFGLAGAWWLVTGRKIYRLPQGVREGWPLRVMGLVYLLFAAFLIYQVFHGSFSAEGVALGYFFLVVGIAIAVSRTRKERVAEPPAAQQ